MHDGHREPIEHLSARLHAITEGGGFAACAAATRASFAGVPEGADPERVLEGYRAVLVLAAPPASVTSSGPYGPVLLDERASASLTAVRACLEASGYRVKPVVGGDVSLPRAAVAAGLGETSPVGALVTAGYGLSLTLVGLVTDAPLPGPTPGGSGAGVGEDGICRACGRCTHECPATLPGAFDAAWCTGCGVCVAVCPLGPGPD